MFAKHGTSSTKEARKWRLKNPEKARAKSKKDSLVKRSRDHDENKFAYKNECKCIICGMVFFRDDALLRGYKFLPNCGGNRIICDECA